jgi:hypothetical protein
MIPQFSRGGVPNSGQFERGAKKSAGTGCLPARASGQTGSRNREKRKSAFLSFMLSSANEAAAAVTALEGVTAPKDFFT